MEKKVKIVQDSLSTLRVSLSQSVEDKVKQRMHHFVTGEQLRNVTQDLGSALSAQVSENANSLEQTVLDNVRKVLED